MALFTLDNASRNPLKYEQLDSEETVTAASSLPTSAAAQMATGTEKNSLQGTAAASTATAPLRPTMGSGADTGNTGFNAAANTNGAYGAQADTQSFGGVATTYAPNGNSLSAESSFSNASYGGDIAQSSSASSKSDINNVQITINNPPGNPNPPTNPPGNPNPPTNPPGNPDNPPAGTHNPDITVNLDTGLLPGVHADINIAETLQPVSTLLENTVTDLLSGNPQTVANLVTNTLGTVDNLLTGTALNAAIGNIPLLGQGNGGGTAQLINLGLGDTGDTPVAPLLDARILQNLPSLSEASLTETLGNVTEAVPTLLQNPLGNLSGTLSGLLGGTGPLAEITLGGDNSTGEGILADLNVLDALPLNQIPVVGNVLEGVTDAIPLGNGTLADALGGTAQLLGVTVGDNDSAPSLIADVGLLQSGNLASVSVPLLGEQPLLEVPLDANDLPDIAATLENTVSGLTDTLAGLGGDTGNNPAGDLLEGVTGATSTIVENLTGAIDNAPVQEAVSNVTDTVSTVVENVTGTVQDTLPVIADTASQTLNALQDALESLHGGSTQNPVTTVANVIDPVTNALADATTDIPVVGNVTAQVSDTLQDLLTALPTDNLPNLGDTLANLAGTLSDGLGGNNSLLNLSLNDANSPQGQLADLNLLPTSGTLAEATLPLLQGNPLIELTAGHDGNTSNGSLLDVGLIGDGSTATVTVPLLGDAPLIDVSLHPNGTSASLLDISLPNIDLTGSQLLDVNLGSGNTHHNGSLLTIDVLQSTDIPGGDILSQMLDTVSTTVGSVTAPVTDALAAVITQPEAITSSVTSTVADITASVPETLSNTLAQTTTSVADVINSTIAQTSAPASVVETVAQTTTALTGATNAVTQTTAAVVNTVTAPVVPVVNTVTAPVNNVIKTITSPLHGLFNH